MEKRYELKFPEMDEQHHYLYSLFDMIEEGPKITNMAVMAALIKEIERYVIFHFTSEEHLMRAYEFPGYAMHQSDHEIASAKMVQFMDDFEADRLNPAAFRIFMTGWLMEHSALSDSEYVKWIQQERNRIGISRKE